MVDGGVTSTFPADIFDRSDGVPPRWPTFFIGVMGHVPPDQRVDEPAGPFALVRALVLTGLGGRDGAELDMPMNAQRSIFIDTSYVEATDFRIDRATKQRLYDDGHAAAQRFLQTFSFATYREFRTKPAAS